MSFLDIADLSVVTVEGKTLAVDNLSNDAKLLVEIYNAFRKDEAAQKLELKKVQAAMTMVSHEIVAQIKSEEEAASATDIPTEPAIMPEIIEDNETEG